MFDFYKYRIYNIIVFNNFLKKINIITNVRTKITDNEKGFA